MSVGDLAQVLHHPGVSGWLFCTAPDLSGSGQVDMLPLPVESAQATATIEAPGYIDTPHVTDTWMCGSLSLIFTHPPEDKRQISKIQN